MTFNSTWCSRQKQFCTFFMHNQCNCIEFLSSPNKSHGGYVAREWREILPFALELCRNK